MKDRKLLVIHWQGFGLPIRPDDHETSRSGRLDWIWYPYEYGRRVGPQAMAVPIFGDHKHYKIVEVGDIVLMYSDGTYVDNLSWLKDYIKS